MLTAPGEKSKYSRMQNTKIKRARLCEQGWKKETASKTGRRSLGQIQTLAAEGNNGGGRDT